MKKGTIIFIVVFIIASGICISISLLTEIPLFDAILTSGKTIHQEIEQSISLKFLIDDKLFLNTLGEPMNVNLTGKGWMLAIIFNLGIPLMLAWSLSIRLGRKKS